MSDLELYIKDKRDGSVRRYGESRHDSLRVVNGVLTYENLQNGDGSPYGYCFCDKDGNEDWLDNYPAEEYIHIGKTAVDAVEVVRCKDCRWAKSYERYDGEIGFYCHFCGHSFTYGERWERLFTPIKEKDDFCSYGERREENAVD